MICCWAHPIRNGMRWALCTRKRALYRNGMDRTWIEDWVRDFEPGPVFKGRLSERVESVFHYDKADNRPNVSPPSVRRFGWNRVQQVFSLEVVRRMVVGIDFALYPSWNCIPKSVAARQVDVLSESGGG